MKNRIRLIITICFLILLSCVGKENFSASTAQEQIDRLTEIYTQLYPAVDLGYEKSYFTVNGKACTHGTGGTCSNCKLSSIVTSLKTKNPTKFTTTYNKYVSLNNSGKLQDGWTCKAFARFVHLYVFGNGNSENDEMIKIKVGVTDISSIAAKLAPGDKLVYYDPTGHPQNTYYHNSIVLGCSNSRITILECNWPTTEATGTAIVRVREYTFSDFNDLAESFEVWRAKNSLIPVGTSLGSERLALAPNYITLPIGGTFNCTLGQALDTSVDKSKLIWSSADTGIATVSNGVITAKKAGEVTITVKTSDGIKDTITVNVLSVPFTLTEKWIVAGPQIKGRVTYDTEAPKAARNDTGYYVVGKGATLHILAKIKDDKGNTWGFGAGYNEFLEQDIWAWFDLLDDELGDETYVGSYAPAKPSITVEKSSEGAITVSWNSVASATSYELHINGSVVRTGITGTSATYNLTSGSTASVKVVAINANFPYSNLYQCTIASNAVNFTMPECAHPSANRELRNATQATCSKEGYTGDTYCTLCDKKISSGSVVAKLSHNYSSQWNTDRSSHWHKCTVCGAVKDKDVHAYDNSCDTTCNKCGYTRTIVHAYNDKWSTDGQSHWHECIVCNHKNNVEKHIPGSAATETSPQKCSVCGYVLKPALGHKHEYSKDWKNDETQHWHECSCKAVTGSASHSFDNACDTTCNVCGYKRLITHKYSEIWLTDTNGHWHICVVCGKKKDEALHTVGPAATETSPQLCTVCGYVIRPALDHSHDSQRPYDMDEQYHWKVCTCGDVLTKEKHKWDSGVVIELPSTIQEGLKQYHCTICEMTYYQTLEKLEDDKVNENITATAELQLEKLQQIYEELFATRASYFTVNGKACTHDKASTCKNCRLSDILTHLNSQNPEMFGEVYRNYNKGTTVNGYTCKAFARFVQLYVFGTGDTEYETVYSKTNASYEAFQKLAPGDKIVYYKSSSQTSAHNSIFLECDEDGVTVLECNWNHKTYGVAVIEVNTHTYKTLNDYATHLEILRSPNSLIQPIGDFREEESENPATEGSAGNVSQDETESKSPWTGVAEVATVVGGGALGLLKLLDSLRKRRG